MMIRQKTDNKDLRERAKLVDQVTYDDMKKEGRYIIEKSYMDNAFYRTQRGQMGGASTGMSGCLNDYSYVAKQR